MVFDYGHGFINSKIANLISKKSIFLALNAQVNSMSVGRHSIEKYNIQGYSILIKGSRKLKLEKITHLL